MKARKCKREFSLVGIGIGIGISSGVAAVARIALQSPIFQVYFPPWLIIGTLLFSFIVGCASGLLPAIQASQLPPVEALREE